MYPFHLAVGKALRVEGGTTGTNNKTYFSFGGNGAYSIDAPGVPSVWLIVDNSGNVGIGAPVRLPPCTSPATVTVADLNLLPVLTPIWHGAYACYLGLRSPAGFG